MPASLPRMNCSIFVVVSFLSFFGGLFSYLSRRLHRRLPLFFLLFDSLLSSLVSPFVLGLSTRDLCSITRDSNIRRRATRSGSLSEFLA